MNQGSTSPFLFLVYGCVFVARKAAPCVDAPVMNQNAFKARKRYMEPDAWSEPLPRSTIHDLKKRSLALPNPAPSVNPTFDSGAAASATVCNEVLNDINEGNLEENSRSENDDPAPAAEVDRPSTTEEDPPPSGSSPFLLEFATLLENGSSLSVGDALVLLMDIAIKHFFFMDGNRRSLKVQQRSVRKECPPGKQVFVPQVRWSITRRNVFSFLLSDL